MFYTNFLAKHTLPLIDDREYRFVIQYSIICFLMYRASFGIICLVWVSKSFSVNNPKRLCQEIFVNTRYQLLLCMNLVAIALPGFKITFFGSAMAYCSCSFRRAKTLSNGSGNFIRPLRLIY